MKISLILPTYGQSFPQAAFYLTANLEKHNHSADVVFIDIDDIKKEQTSEPSNFDMIEKALNSSHKVIAIGCMTDLLPHFLYSVINFKKKYPGKIIILGGPGPSEFAESLIANFKEIDFIVKDRNPIVFAELITAFETKDDTSEIKGVVSRRNNKVQYISSGGDYFENFILPTRHSFALKNFNHIRLVSVEGCPYQCTFCSSKPLIDAKLKYRALSDVLEEIKTLKSLSPNKMLYHFVDEAFVVNHRRVLDFCAALKKNALAINWSCFGRVNCMSTDLMSTMREAGCSGIFFGIESGSNSVLDKIKKGFTIEQAVRVLLEAKKYFKKITASFIWGFPFETFDEFVQTLLVIKFLKKEGIKTNFKLLYPVVNSEIYENYKTTLIFSELGRANRRMKIAYEQEDFIEFVKSNEYLFPRYSMFAHSEFEKKLRYIHDNRINLKVSTGIRNYQSGIYV